MAKVTYIEHSGKEHVIDVPVGSTIMEGAVKNRVPGIDADCGGADQFWPAAIGATVWKWPS